MDRDWDNLSDMVAHWAGVRPDAAAIREGRETIDWRGFALHVRSAAVDMRERGIKEDDLVGLALGNSSELVILLMAAFRVGAVPLIVSARASEPLLGELSRRLGLAAIYVEAMPDAKLAPITVNLMPGWRPPPVSAKTDARSARGADRNRTGMLSSGSTGEPRAHVSTQRQRFERLVVWRAATQRHWSEERRGILVVVAGLGASMNQNALLNQISFGGTIAIGPPPASPADLVRALGAWRDAVCALNPGQARALLRCAEPGKMLLPDAQLLRIGGELLTVEDKRALRERVCPTLYEIYGAAGIGTITVLAPDEMEAHTATVGRPAPGVEVEIVDETGRPLPTGTAGQIRVRGKGVGEGFLAATSVESGAPEAYREGWVHPGDLGRLDAEGYLTVLGRLGERIAQAGGDVFPAEIETAIQSLDGVTEVVVVGRPAGGGPAQEAVAFVVKRADLPHESVRAHCAARLPPGKSPAFIYYMDKLPRLAGGKIDRQALRRIAQPNAPKR